MGEGGNRASARKVGETVSVERQRSLAPRRGAAPTSNRPGQSEAEAGRKGRDQDIETQKGVSRQRPDRRVFAQERGVAGQAVQKLSLMSLGLDLAG